jgi:putative endonuclease
VPSAHSFFVYIEEKILMGQIHLLGKKGEAIARQYLLRKGWTILETNWRISRAEVDLIAKDGEVLVFIEVKTRSTDYFGQPAEFVESKKEMMLAGAASAYMEEIGHDWEIRFDIIGIVFQNEQQYELKHIPDAFFPGEW